MEARRRNTIAQNIRVKKMQKSLNSYAKAFGFQVSDKLSHKDGKLVYAPVGFDSPLLLLTPLEYIRIPQTKEDLAKNKSGAGVEFHFGMNGSKELVEFLAELKAKGFTVIREPDQPNERS